MFYIAKKATAVNLRTAKKYDSHDSHDSQLHAICEYGYDKISTWTRRELQRLQTTSKVPICVELQNGDYTIGTHSIEKYGVAWRVDKKVEFTNKTAAIYYGTLLSLSRLASADDLHRLDRAVSTLEFDKTLFRSKLDKAHLEGNQFKIDLYATRFDETKRKLAVAKQEFTKKLSQAKYIYTEVLGNYK